MLAILIFLIFFILVWASEIQRKKLSKVVKHIPGPKEIPILGSEFVLKNDDITDFQSLDGKEFTAPIMKFFLGPKLLMLISEPSAMQQLLANCQEKPYIISFFNLEFGLFSAKYHIWRPLRKGLSPAFSQRLSNSFIPTFDKHYRQLVKAMSHHLGTYNFDFHSLVQKQSFHLTLETTLNSSLETNIDLHQFEEVEDIISQRTFKRFLHLNAIYQLTGLYKRETEIRAAIESMIDQIMEKRSKQMKSANSTEDSNSHFFLDQLLHLTKDGKPLSPVEIRQNIIAIIFAGYETTAVTITYTILLLAMHPAVEKLVMNELTQFYKRGDPVTYELLRELNYLEMVIKETMRLFPSVPLTIRESIEEMNIDGIGRLPKGVTFVCSFYRLHRWESIWGEDAHKFRPERFEPAEVAKRHPSSFMPFGSGSRNCLGNRYAMLSIKTGLVHMLSNYRFSTRLKLEDIKLKFSVTLKMLNKNILKVERREED